MQQRKARRASRTRYPSRPGALSLLLQIFKGAFADGMQIPALLCLLLTAAFYYEQFPYHEMRHRHRARARMGTVRAIGSF